MSGSPFDRMLRRCIDRFGVDSVYMRDGEETPVKGIFDNNYETVEFESGPPISSRTIQIGYRADALPYFPRKGDQIRVQGKLYRVVEAQPDSEFGITLILKDA